MLVNQVVKYGLADDPLSVVFAAALLIAPSVLTSAEQNATRKTAAATSFELTVDSIMRGPKLVGYAPTSLRWSADS